MTKRNTKTGKRRSTMTKDAGDILTGLAKEVYLIGLYSVQELTGADLHHQPQKSKRSWEKKWGER